MSDRTGSDGPAGEPAAQAVIDIPVIELVHPLLGFPGAERFALVRLDDDGVLCSLQSLDGDLRFLVVPPQRFFPDYSPEVGDDVVADLDIRSLEEVLLLVILTAGTSLADTTANLLAPLLINTRTREACQVVLDDPGLSTSAPLIR